jgi:hypothetical protein
MQNTPFAAQQRQVNKFLEATRKLGAQMDQDQGTTRVIYDSTGDVFGQNTFVFFDQVTSKTYPATNLQQNRFQPGEGMVIKEIGFTDQNGRASLNNKLGFAVLDFFIGNNRVLKSLPLLSFSTVAALNPLNQIPTPPVVGTNLTTGTYIRLRTNLVIPPMVQFSARLTFPYPIGTETTAEVNIKMMVKGYGKLFNPNANY